MFDMVFMAITKIIETSAFSVAGHIRGLDGLLATHIS